MVILFTGWIKHEEIIHYIQRSKIVIVPSLSEPLGVVVIEMLACSVPIIEFNTGSIPDMNKHGKNGWLVESNNPEILGKTIESVLSNKTIIESASKEALKTAAKFSIKKFNKEILNLFDGFVKSF